LERKKRYVKERRKLILEESIILFPQRNKFDIQQAKRAKYGLIHPKITSLVHRES
jgi:rRNA-processing protein FCF1